MVLIVVTLLLQFPGPRCDCLDLVLARRRSFWILSWIQTTSTVAWVVRWRLLRLFLFEDIELILRIDLNKSLSIIRLSRFLLRSWRQFPPFQLLAIINIRHLIRQPILLLEHPPIMNYVIGSLRQFAWSLLLLGDNKRTGVCLRVVGGALLFVFGRQWWWQFDFVEIIGTALLLL